MLWRWSEYTLQTSCLSLSPPRFLNCVYCGVWVYFIIYRHNIHMDTSKVEREIAKAKVIYNARLESL